MCILFIYIDPSPSENRFRLIIASNRDEFYSRPAKNAFFCPETKVIGGRDMENERENGMWLGISLKNAVDLKNIKFGAILNLTGEKRKPNGGRGYIVTNYLNNDSSFTDYIKTLNLDKLNAFNFIGIEMNNQTSSVHYQSNSSNMYSKFEGKQVLGFGNSTLPIPLTKVNNGVDKFTEIVHEHCDVNQKTLLIKDLLKFLKWEQKHLPDAELNRRAPDAYEYLSSIFVKIIPATYGTRTHSIILIDYDWNVEFVEVTLKQPIDPLNPEWDTQHIKSQL